MNDDAQQILHDWLTEGGYDSLHDWMIDSDWVWNPATGGYDSRDGDAYVGPEFTIDVAWAAMEASQA